jgi:hypothetical protein
MCRATLTLIQYIAAETPQPSPRFRFGSIPTFAANVNLFEDSFWCAFGHYFWVVPIWVLPLGTHFGYVVRVLTLGTNIRYAFLERILGTHFGYVFWVRTLRTYFGY